MMTKIKFDRPLSAAFSPNIPTTIREYDTSMVEERINAIRKVFSSLTESIDAMKAQVDSTNQQLEARVREISLEVVRAFLMKDGTATEQRLAEFIDDIRPLINLESEWKLAVNKTTADIIPQLIENESSPPKLEIDEQLQDGDCRVEFGQQGLFLSLDAQLAEIRKQMAQLSTSRRASA